MESLSDHLPFEEFAACMKRELLGKYPGSLTRGTHLFEEVGMDSLEMFHIVVLIEDLSGFEIELEAVPLIETVGQAYDFYDALCGVHASRTLPG
jgi:acyl carrier protein